jgi:DNA primase
VSDASFRQFLDTLKLTVSIEDVVSARVPGLKRAGAEWKGCCPFHEERTPSFHVVPDKQFFHCFGCGASGDVFVFLQRFDGVEFMEAVEELATSVGLEVPKKRSRGPKDGREARLVEALERAAKLFERSYRGPQGEAARRYMDERGLGREVQDAFGIGWAPADGRALVGAARAAGFELDALVEAGLVKRPEDDGAGRSKSPFDFFRGRLIVPIRDGRGRTIGFGGRVLPGTDGPKYINTAETPLFHKGRTVFGLDLAAEAARRLRHIVVMEGYTDVMAAHQAGLRQAVAVLGTATTEDHARILRRTGAQRLTLVFDGDRAGRAAALKALRGSLSRGEFDTVDVVALPEGSDPCDLLVTVDPASGERGGRFVALLEQAVDWFTFLQSGLVGLGPKELADAIDAALEVVAVLPNPVEREARVRELAEGTGLSQSSIEARFEEVLGSARRSSAAARPLAARADVSNRGSIPGREQVEPAPRQPHAAPASPGAPAIRPAARSRDQHRELRAWAELIGACLVDNALVVVHRDRLESAREGRGPAHEGLARLLEVMCDVYEEDELLHERGAPQSGHVESFPVNASRLASALAALAHPAEDDGDDAAPWETGSLAGESGVAAERALAERITDADVEELTSIALRIENTARQADDVRAMARGAASALDSIERIRTTAEMLAAAARGDDPDAARLEAANRAYGLDRTVGGPASTHP